MNFSFKKSQEEHEHLLEQEYNEEDITNEVKLYIKQARRESQNYSLDERDSTRANLRYWAAYIFEKTDEYPSTGLSPLVKPQKTTTILQQTGRLGGIATLIVLIILGTFQVIKSIFFSQPSTPQPVQSIITQASQTLLIISNLAILLFGVIVWKRGDRVVQGVKNVAENIRKTIIGGGKRGKPLASINIKDGPVNAIGKDFKIYTERVKLGRDPQLADMTFYAPDAKSSVSGLHASIEKENELWRIIAVSTSKSETFVDGGAIPFNQPYPLHDGQEVRLGYLAQQPVTFIFNTDASDAPRKTTLGDLDNSDDINQTDVGSGPTPIDFGTPGETKTDSDMDDDFFAEYK